MAVLLAGVTASACTARTRPEVVPPTPMPRSSSGLEVIGELKAFEEALGGQETENFLKYSARATSDDRCYFTGKLQLPEYYSGLRMAREEEARVPTLLGSGERLFDGVGDDQHGLELVRTVAAPKVTYLKLARR